MEENNYFDETSLLSKALWFLYNNREYHIAQDFYDQPQFAEFKPTIEPQVLFERLADEGYVNKKSVAHRVIGNNVMYYAISLEGIELVNSTPVGYKNLPYSYHNFRKDVRREAEQHEKEIDNKIKKLTIENSLNHRKEIRFNRWFTATSLIIAIIAILTPLIIDNMKELNVTKTETTIKDFDKFNATQEQLLKVLSAIDSNLHNIDSLVGKHK